MINLNYPVEDVKFLLTEVFSFDQRMSEIPKLSELDLDLMLSVVGECEKFCNNVLLPLNSTGDAEGCKFHDGQVTTPTGFPEAYKKFVENGWASLSGDVEYGGQGLSHALQFLTDEIISASNMSFGLFPALTRGACEVIKLYATDEIKEKYLPNLISGEWTGVMSLTEAGAGSDLSLVTTRANPNGDGSYKINGTKIFISSGDHDFGGNIIHLVLARLPDAPSGSGGLSLFLVPKYFVSTDGEIGEKNKIIVGGIETKMGIHAQPTCVLNYEDATGWLIGDAHSGLKAMFSMMNTERLFVGTQALGVAEIAYQKATDYAQERKQGRQSLDDSNPAPIICHPDVKRMLMTISSVNEAARALCLLTALELDKRDYHPSEAEQKEASNFVSLVTPIIKAALSDFGLESCVMAQQVFGGHGYIHEWGMEQYVRDVRITQIYEGTNGIQSLDLITRKIFLNDAKLPFQLFEHIEADIFEAQQFAEIDDVSQLILNSLDALDSITSKLVGLRKEPVVLQTVASDYLRLFSLVLLGWMWIKILCTVKKSSDVSEELKTGKLMKARFFATHILPSYLSLLARIQSDLKR